MLEKTGARMTETGGEVVGEGRKKELTQMQTDRDGERDSDLQIHSSGTDTGSVKTRPI